jgi:hypothetical protein
MASTIKVNNIQNQCGANIANKCGSTVTLGASGDTITLACGASQTGFGRTGTVDWDTTAKTASFTAVSGNGYFVNTTSGTITATLPATPSAGDIVAFKDYANTFDTNKLSLDRNGSNIDGAANNFEVTAEGQSLTLVYVDGTRGWVPTDAAKASDFSQEASYVTATGGTVTCCGDYKIHTFTGPGTFCVSNAGNPFGSNTVEYIVVAGGGGSGAGGGGGGGFRFASPSIAPLTYPAKPLAAPAALPVTATGYPITVGAGGPGSTSGASPSDDGVRGSNSIFSTIISTGGGGGAAWNFVPGRTACMPGGSGGGASARTSPTTFGGTGNTPPTSPPQGQPGGDTAGNPAAYGGSGGGGALAAGIDSPGTTSGAPGGVGAGVPNAFGTSGENCGSYYYFSGGGGGAGRVPGTCSGTGGLGGGKPGTNPGVSPGPAGTANTGGGAGGGGYQESGDLYSPGGAGGSGIVIIRYKYQ